MSETERKSGVEQTWYPLDAKVLAVLVIDHVMGDWSAYVGAVPGILHSEEWQQVAHHGSHLPEETAAALFESHLAVANTERELAGQEWLQWRG